MKDHIPAPIGHFTPRKEWQDMATKREKSPIIRPHRKAEDLSRGSKQLLSLITGNHVYIQDQHGNTPKRWNKSGIILEVGPHDSFLVKVDGSGKVTKRNRQFLRRFEPFSAEPRTATALPPVPPAAHLASPPPAPISPPAAPVTLQLPPLPISDVPDISLTMDQPGSPPHTVDSPIPVPKPTIPKHLRERWVVNPNLTSYQPPTQPPTLLHVPTQAPSLTNLAGKLATANCFPGTANYFSVYPTNPFYLPQPTAQMSLMYKNNQLPYLPYAVPDAY